MASQQQSLQQQLPWWSGPMHGLGAALQGMQQNMQQLANNVQRSFGPHASPPRVATGSLTMATASSSSSQALVIAPHSGSSTSRGGQELGSAARLQQHDTALHHLESRIQQKQQHQVKAVTKEELGHATWVFLHTLAAQFPEHPTRQQQRDARQLIDSFTRIYPCADCAQHFQEIVKRDPLT